MRAAQGACAVLAACMAAKAIAGAGEPGGSPASPEAKPSWEFAVTVYPTDVRDGDNYTSAIAAADRGPLHLEARANYESVGARSAFIGWTFSGGDAVKWQLRPLLGGVWGTTQATHPPWRPARAGSDSMSTSRPNMYGTGTPRPTTTLMPGPNWASGRSSGCAPGLPASAPESTVASVTSSAGPSRNLPGGVSRWAVSGSTREREDQDLRRLDRRDILSRTGRVRGWRRSHGLASTPARARVSRRAEMCSNSSLLRASCVGCGVGGQRLDGMK